MPEVRVRVCQKETIQKVKIDRRTEMARSTYQIMQAGKSARSFRAVKVLVKGRKNAIELARKYHDEHPDKRVGVFTMQGIKMFKPKKK